MTVKYSFTLSDNIPLKFVNEKNIIRAADDTDKFIVRLCGGCFYEGHTVRVALNMQNGVWDPDSGISLDVTVYSQDGRTITTNLQHDEPMEDFSFIYKAEYGDLVIKAKTGKHTTFTYTVTLQFSRRKTAPSVDNSCVLRQKMNAKEIGKMKSVTSFTNSLGYQRGHVLKPAFRKKIKLHQCFLEMRPDNPTVSTVGPYNPKLP